MPDAPDPATTPPPDPAGRLWFELFNEIGILAQLSRALFETAQPDGLTLPQFTVLNHLVRLGDGKPPLDLARAFQTPKASLTNTLAGLEARGLIETRPHPKDGRSKLVHLTGAGRARREAAIDRVGPELARLAAEADPGAIERLLPGLAALRRTLDENRGAGSPDARRPAPRAD
jgi:DNA-binding MarR family transcriptional regulator